MPTPRETLLSAMAKEIKAGKSDVTRAMRLAAQVLKSGFWLEIPTEAAGKGRGGKCRCRE